MKRLVLAASLVFAVMAGGCDDDGDGTPTDGGRSDALTDGGGDGGGATGRCTGTFSTLTRAQLGGATAAGGKCAMAKDLDVICTANLGDRARTCGTTCLQSGLTGAQIPGCVSSCIAAQDLSAGCADCYRDLFSCTLAKCNACTADPSSAACMTCQVMQGCLPTFFQCTGLPGGGPAPDGGTDGPVDTGADRPPETNPDVPVEAGTPDGGADAADATAG